MLNVTLCHNITLLRNVILHCVKLYTIVSYSNSKKHHVDRERCTSMKRYSDAKLHVMTKFHTGYICVTLVTSVQNVTLVRKVTLMLNDAFFCDMSQ